MVKVNKTKGDPAFCVDEPLNPPIHYHFDNKITENQLIQRFTSHCWICLLFTDSSGIGIAPAFLQTLMSFQSLNNGIWNLVSFIKLNNLSWSCFPPASHRIHWVLILLFIIKICGFRVACVLKWCSLWFFIPYEASHFLIEGGHSFFFTLM